MENKYYLAIETKPNNYFPINLLELKITEGFTTTKLEELDKFTLRFSEEELKTAIKEANLLEIDDNMALVIIYNEKSVVRKAKVLSKDNYYDMWSYLKNNITDKVFINRVYNFLKTKVPEDSITLLKENLDINFISSLPYQTVRKLYFYLYEK